MQSILDCRSMWIHSVVLPPAENVCGHVYGGLLTIPSDGNILLLTLHCLRHFYMFSYNYPYNLLFHYHEYNLQNWKTLLLLFVHNDCPK